MLKRIRGELSEKDGMIEFMEFVLREKQHSLNLLVNEF
jgi:hypothetical protein